MMFGHSNRSMFVLFLSPQSETPWGPPGLASAGILRPRFTLAAILGRISAWNLVWSHSMASPRSKNWGQAHWNVQLRSSMFWRGPKSCTASVTKPWFKFKGVRPKTAKEGTTGIVRAFFLSNGTEKWYKARGAAAGNCGCHGPLHPLKGYDQGGVKPYGPNIGDQWAYKIDQFCISKLNQIIYRFAQDWYCK